MTINSYIKTYSYKVTSDRPHGNPRLPPCSWKAFPITTGGKSVRIMHIISAEFEIQLSGKYRIYLNKYTLHRMQNERSEKKPHLFTMLYDDDKSSVYTQGSNKKDRLPQYIAK